MVVTVYISKCYWTAKVRREANTGVMINIFHIWRIKLSEVESSRLSWMIFLCQGLPVGNEVV